MHLVVYNHPCTEPQGYHTCISTLSNILGQLCQCEHTQVQTYMCMGMYTCVHTGVLTAVFLLETYFQIVHSTIGRYETPSLHTAIEMLRPG